MEKTKNQKKRFAVVAAVLCLALAAGLGTYAWLTATSHLTNSFTVGNINQPTKNPDPTNPDQPGSEDWKGTGNLIETKWVADSKLTPGASIDKNPNVGLGAGSDDAYVFVYVKNALVKTGTGAANTPYFTIDTNKWTPVPDQTTTSADGKYLSGLFMYTKDAATPGEPALLSATAESDAFTGELFEQVIVPNTLTNEMVNTDASNKANMTVYAYLFGANQADGSTSAAQNALNQAKAWATTEAAK